MPETQHDDQHPNGIVMAEIMTPDKANFSGHVHGGHLMQLLDKVAYACAARYSGHYVVTLSVDRVLFKKPIFVGELVSFYASVNYVGTSSMEVGIKVIAENLLKGERRHTNTCFFTMVAVDEKTGKSAQVKPLEPKTAVEKRRFEEGKSRRALWREYQEKHAQTKLLLKEKHQ